MSNGPSFNGNSGYGESAARISGVDSGSWNTESYYFQLMRPIQDRGSI